MAGYICISVGVCVEYVVWSVCVSVEVCGWVATRIYFLWDLCGIVIVFVSVAGYKGSVWYTCVSVRIINPRCACAARVTV